MIEGELSNPRIASCYVSEVALNPGGKSARVYVALDGAVPNIEKAEQDTVAGLEAALPLRKILSKIWSWTKPWAWTSADFMSR